MTKKLFFGGKIKCIDCVRECVCDVVESCVFAILLFDLIAPLFWICKWSIVCEKKTDRRAVAFPFCPLNRQSCLVVHPIPLPAAQDCSSSPPPHLHIFTRCIVSCFFPLPWKQSYVTVFCPTGTDWERKIIIRTSETKFCLFSLDFTFFKGSSPLRYLKT